MIFGNFSVYSEKHILKNLSLCTLTQFSQNISVVSCRSPCVLKWEDPHDSTVYCIDSDTHWMVVSGTCRYGVVSTFSCINTYFAEQCSGGGRYNFLGMGGGGQTEKGTNFHTGFLCGKHFKNVLRGDRAPPPAPMFRRPCNVIFREYINSQGK